MFKGNVAAVTAGVSGASFPFWETWLTSGWSTLIGVGGAIVLALTIWNKCLAIRLKNRDLRKK